MKTLFLIVSLLIVNSVIAQKDTITVDDLFKDVKLNYSVPDLPAFNALESEPGNLLRPSSPKDFSVVANEFYNGSEIIIPKSIAIEITPITLLRYNKLTLEDYNKSPVLYNSRISIGSLRNENNTSRIAIGFRTTIINDGDIKSDKNIDKLISFLRNKNDMHVKYIIDEHIQLNLKPYEFEKYKDSLDRSFETYFKSIYKDKQDSISEIYKDNHLWNAQKLDVAFAFAGSSPDSLAKNIQFSSFTAWITYACPLFRKGQFMIGGNTDYRKFNNANFWSISIPARLYYGTNKIKGFAEGQYLYKQQDNTNNVMVKLGVEYNLENGFWLDFSAGIKKDISNNTSQLVSGFKLIYGLPEKI